MMRQIWLLARRDLVQRARSRAFLITLLITVGAVMALGPLVNAITGSQKPTVIGITGTTADGLAPTIEAIAKVSDVSVSLSTYDTVSAGEAAVDSGDASVLVIDSSELVWKERSSPQIEAIVQGAVQQLERQAAAAQLGLDTSQVASIVSPPPMTSRTLQPPDPERIPRIVGANIATVLMFISIVMFGQFVLLGVMEEKASRVVEVVLSRAKPTEVLAGKVIGIGLLGLIELVALGGAALVTLRSVNVSGVQLPQLGLGVIASLILWFILGYAFYAVVYAAFGSTISRQEDVQGAAMLPTLLLLPGYFIGLTMTETPSTIAQVFSLIPFWSPMVMPARIALGEAAVWEVAAAIGLLVASALALIWLAGRIYSGAILSIGKKVRLREAWRGAR
jgi:ABC-2 type transport system permease protein